MNKKTALISLSSVCICILYSLLLFSRYNNYFITSTFKLIFFLLIPILYYKFIDKEKVTKWVIINKKKLKMPIILSILTFVFIILSFILLRNLFSKEMILAGLLKEGITKNTYPMVIIYIVFINAFLEEFLFRGFIFLELYQMGYKLYAHIFSSILFSVYHVGMMGTWFSFEMFLFCLIGLIIAGIFFNELDRRCESMLGGFFVHLGANLGINLIGAYFFYF